MDILPTFLSFCLKAEHRQLIKGLGKKIKLEPPFDAVLQDMMEIQVDIPKSDCLAIISNHAPNLVRKFTQMADGISPVLGYKAVQELVALDSIHHIGDTLKRKGTPLQKLGAIHELSDLKITTTEPVAKLSSQLLIDRTAGLAELFGYPISKGELTLLSAYPGVGKTTTTLSVIKYLTEMNVKCLYITIEDWSETTLKLKLEPAGMPDFWVAIYPEAGLPEIENEIISVAPDFVAVDSMTVIQGPQFDGQDYKKLGWVIARLRKLAQQYNIHLLTTHQLTNYTRFPSPVDLQDAKSHLLAHVDLALGLGEEGLGSPEKNITTMKVRRYPVKPTLKVWIDATLLTLNEEEHY